jgi:hypothetical protein
VSLFAQIGRDPDADIVLQDDTVSRRHAEIELLSEDHIQVRDLGSKNGTWLSQHGSRKPISLSKVSIQEDLMFGSHTISAKTLIKEMKRLQTLATPQRYGIVASAVSGADRAAPDAQSDEDRQGKPTSPDLSNARQGSESVELQAESGDMRGAESAGQDRGPRRVPKPGCSGTLRRHPETNEVIHD